MKLPRSVYNWISVIGGAIALISFLMFIFLFAISFFFDQGSSYLGLFLYIVIPIFLVIGLILIPIGMIRKVRRDKRIEEGKELMRPYIDLNNRRHRNAFIVFIIGTTIFLFFTAIGGYEAFHYTESVEFCGKLCHKVMKPEYVAYQNSAHARVTCVECHVGPGADWYVRSKLSGLYQVYAVTTGNYPKPIPTPISNLRPARETCERCHWPEQFYARQLRFEKYYLADADNSEWDVLFEVKTSALHKAQGLEEGIHWHIHPDIQIEYIRDSSNSDVIPWVRYTNLRTNETRVYEYEDDPLNKDVVENSDIRVMDCIDCHSRPSHNYHSPSTYINHAFTSGDLSVDLPELKYVLMDILKNDFGTTDSALFAIDDGIREYYKSNYPDIYDTEQEKIDDAVMAAQNEFQKNAFPEMKVTWAVYPDNTGHIEYNGCFRCHDDKHIANTGDVISRDCNLCHHILGQGNPDTLQLAKFNDYLEFKHPVDIGEAWKEMNCVECHRELY